MKSKKCKNKNVKTKTLKKGGSGVSAIFGTQEHRFKKNIKTAINKVDHIFYDNKLYSIFDDDEKYVKTPKYIKDIQKRYMVLAKENLKWYNMSLDDLTVSVKQYIQYQIILKYGLKIINTKYPNKFDNLQQKEELMIKIFNKLQNTLECKQVFNTFFGTPVINDSNAQLDDFLRELNQMLEAEIDSIMKELDSRLNESTVAASEFQLPQENSINRLNESTDDTSEFQLPQVLNESTDDTSALAQQNSISCVNAVMQLLYHLDDFKNCIQRLRLKSSKFKVDLFCGKARMLIHTFSSFFKKLDDDKSYKIDSKTIPFLKSVYTLLGIDELKFDETPQFELLLLVFKIMELFLHSVECISLDDCDISKLFEFKNNETPNGIYAISLKNPQHSQSIQISVAKTNIREPGKYFVVFINRDRKSKLRKIRINDKLKIGDFTFTLSGVISHQGTPNGHYVYQKYDKQGEFLYEIDDGVKRTRIRPNYKNRYIGMYASVVVYENLNVAPSVELESVVPGSVAPEFISKLKTQLANTTEILSKITNEINNIKKIDTPQVNHHTPQVNTPIKPVESWNNYDYVNPLKWVGYGGKTKHKKYKRKNNKTYKNKTHL